MGTQNKKAETWLGGETDAQYHRVDTIINSQRQAHIGFASIYQLEIQYSGQLLHWHILHDVCRLSHNNATQSGGGI